MPCPERHPLRTAAVSRLGLKAASKRSCRLRGEPLDDTAFRYVLVRIMYTGVSTRYWLSAKEILALCQRLGPEGDCPFPTAETIQSVGQLGTK